MLPACTDAPFSYSILGLLQDKGGNELEYDEEDEEDGDGVRGTYNSSLSEGVSKLLSSPLPFFRSTLFDDGQNDEEDRTGLREKFQKMKVVGQVLAR